MMVKTVSQRGWRYVLFMSALLAALWLAGSASAGIRADRELGLTNAPGLAAHSPAGGSSADPADTPTLVLVAHITWQAIPQPSSRNTTMTLVLNLRLADGGPLVTYPNLATDASGFFTVPVDSLPAGTYNYQAKGYKNLARGGQVALAGDPVTNVEMGVAPAGDANDDNVVNTTDFMILRAVTGHPWCWGCPTYDVRADFNQTDNVDATDFSLLKSNFGHGGAPPVSP